MWIVYAIYSSKIIVSVRSTHLPPALSTVVVPAVAASSGVPRTAIAIRDAGILIGKGTEPREDCVVSLRSLVLGGSPSLNLSLNLSSSPVGSPRHITPSWCLSRKWRGGLRDT